MTDQEVDVAQRDAVQSDVAQDATGLPPAGPMVSIGAMVEPHLLARLDRLRACMGDSRSRVMEIVMTQGPIDKIEAQYGEAIKTFNLLAERAGVPWWTYTLAYAVAFARQTYPPTAAAMSSPQGGKDARELMAKALKVVKVSAR